MATLTANGRSATYTCIGPFNVLVAGYFGDGKIAVQYLNNSGWVSLYEAGGVFAKSIGNQEEMQVSLLLDDATDPDIEYSVVGSGVSP